VIARDGKRPKHVLIVSSGVLEMCEDSRATPRRLGRGAVLGEYTVFPAAPRWGTAVALTTGSALTLDHERFERFLVAFPESTLALLRLTVERLTAARARASRSQ
jgi:CRP-like cAMP-binding protein